MYLRAGVCLGLAVLSGCRTPEHPVTDPPPVPSWSHAQYSPAGACAASVIAQDPRTRVYLVNGADPFRWAGMDLLAERVRRSGYPHTRYGEVYDIGGFEREIREVHTADPSAQFVLIGFSAGTLAVRAAANRLVRDGVPVAMVGYVGGDYLTDTEYTRPAAVGRIVNVTGNGYLLTGRNLIWNGVDVTGASNVRLVGVAHFDLPTHPRTLAALLAGLTDVSVESPAAVSDSPPGSAGDRATRAGLAR